MHNSVNVLSKSLPPTPSQLHPSVSLEGLDDAPDDYFGDNDDVPLPFPIRTIVADPETGLSLTLCQALGAGSYAVVYLAQEVASGTLYALKCLGKDKLTEDEVAIQRNEVVIHKSLPKHKNIIHLFNVFETPSHLFLLLEYSSGMDMYHWISMQSDAIDPITQQEYPEEKRYSLIKNVFDQVIEGVAQVHACGIAHRDLKPENFLIEYRDSQCVVKLTDFGLATTDAESDEFECGSRPYMSFECRNGYHKPYDVMKADIWSLGIILINLLYHRCPWSDPCPQESQAFSSFLDDRVDFLQRRFENMPGSVARWLGLRAFAFAEAGRTNPRRARPTLEEWRQWTANFVPRMMGELDSDFDSSDDDGYEYGDETDEDVRILKEYYRMLEYEEEEEEDDDDDFLRMQEVEGDVIVDGQDQVVPVNIQPKSSLLDVNQQQRYVPFAARSQPAHSMSHLSSSVPSLDASSMSAFYNPARLRQESWSDAVDMEGTDDLRMDFSAPILFEESDEDLQGHDDSEGDTKEHAGEERERMMVDDSHDHHHHHHDEDDDDHLGLAVDIPDDFIDPAPESTPATSTATSTVLSQSETPAELSFSRERRARSPNLHIDFEKSYLSSVQEAYRTPERVSPSVEISDHLNNLVFIEPEPRLHEGGRASPAAGMALASSLPSSSRLIEAMLPSDSTIVMGMKPQLQSQSQQQELEQAEQEHQQQQPQLQQQPQQQQRTNVLKHEMKKPSRNLQDVKAKPFVFPPLKTSTLLPLSSNKTTAQMLTARPSTNASTTAGTDNNFVGARADGTTTSSGAATANSNVNSTTTTRTTTDLGSQPYIPFPKRRLLEQGLFPPSAASSALSGSLLQQSAGGSGAPSSRDTVASGPMSTRQQQQPQSPTPSWRKTHHRGGSWTSIDDVWGTHRDMARRVIPSAHHQHHHHQQQQYSRNGSHHARTGQSVQKQPGYGQYTSRNNRSSNRLRKSRTGAAGGAGGGYTSGHEREDGAVGLPPRAENKFRPRYKHNRGGGVRREPNMPGSVLPPQMSNGGVRRSQPMARHGFVVDTFQKQPSGAVSSGDRKNQVGGTYQSGNKPVTASSTTAGTAATTTSGPGSGEVRGSVDREVALKQADGGGGGPWSSATSTAPSATGSTTTTATTTTTIGFSSLSRMAGRTNSSRLAGKRNKSLVDLRGLDIDGPSWRTSEPLPSPLSPLATMSQQQHQQLPPLPVTQQQSQADLATEWRSTGAHASNSTAAANRDKTSTAVPSDSATGVGAEDGKDNIYHPPHWYEQQRSNASRLTGVSGGGAMDDTSSWIRDRRKGSVHDVAWTRSPSKSHDGAPLGVIATGGKSGAALSGSNSSHALNSNNTSTSTGIYRPPMLQQQSALTSGLRTARTTASNGGSQQPQQGPGSGLVIAPKMTVTPPTPGVGTAGERGDGQGKQTDLFQDAFTRAVPSTVTGRVPLSQPHATTSAPASSVTQTDESSKPGSRNGGQALRDQRRASVVQLGSQQSQPQQAQGETSSNVTTAATSTMATVSEVPEQQKKIVDASMMSGLGDMLRGLVAYNKGVKVGGEGHRPSSSMSLTTREERSSK
ncbi:hypothetical protein BGW42_001951 [Actinomortierella wolfii]|nr:hypothetical protein BGW42_001951 [Actinomortierella wolfii]